MKYKRIFIGLSSICWALSGFVAYLWLLTPSFETNDFTKTFLWIFLVSFAITMTGVFPLYFSKVIWKSAESLDKEKERYHKALERIKKKEQQLVEEILKAKNNA